MAARWLRAAVAGASAGRARARPRCVLRVHPRTRRPSHPRRRRHSGARSAGLRLAVGPRGATSSERRCASATQSVSHAGDTSSVRRGPRLSAVSSRTPAAPADDATSNSVAGDTAAAGASAYATSTTPRRGVARRAPRTAAVGEALRQAKIADAGEARPSRAPRRARRTIRAVRFDRMRARARRQAPRSRDGGRATARRDRARTSSGDTGPSAPRGRVLGVDEVGAARRAPRRRRPRSPR